MHRPPENVALGHAKVAGIAHLSGCPAPQCHPSQRSEIRWERADTLVNPQIDAAGIHEWPFNPSFPIDVRFFFSGGRQDIRRNRHKYLEFVYVYEGVVNLDVHEKCLTLRAGDLLVMGSDLFHRVSIGSEARVAVLFFQPELIRATDNIGEETEYLLPLLLQGPDFPHIVGPDTGIAEKVHNLIMEIFWELPADASRSRLSVKTYLKMILILLANHYAEYTGARELLDRKQRELERLQPLFAYLEQHYPEKLRLRDAARRCGMSNSYFMSFFKRVTGQSFVSYVIHFRVARAQVLLVNTDMAASEISQVVGFCDQSHFGLVFRNLVGVSPLAYRFRFGNSGRRRTPIRPDLTLRATR
jgi:AraC-like DNA-binding protein